MNNFLKNRGEVDVATQYLIDNGLIQSGLSCKNWEMVMVIPFLKKESDLIDLGSDGGIVLQNAVKLGLKGRKVGIDLAYDKDSYNGGIEMYKADLMYLTSGMINGESVSLNEINSFDTITCLSVIEHQVDFSKFTKECSKLLREGGNVIVSFDFWEPKPSYEKRILYHLSWDILDKNDVLILISEMATAGLTLTSEIDWTTQDAVINDTYCSPVKDVSYTFGILEFIKK